MNNRRRRSWQLRLGLSLLLALILGHAAWPLPALGKEQPDPAGKFFGLTNLWDIQLSLSAADWQQIESFSPRRRGTSQYPWVSATFQCAGETLTNVAIRCKGNSSLQSSRGALKHPFKLHFNRGHKGRTFFGLKELSLNNNFNDATQFREVLAYDVCRQAGLPTPRTAFARVYLTVPTLGTNLYLGLYTLVEPIDETFLKRDFRTAKGTLMKPEGVRSLEYFGESWGAYTNRFVPKTESDPVAQGKFISLTRFITKASDAEFAEKLPEQLDVDRFLAYLAVTSALANYDSFVGNGHNYYLFQPRAEGKATFIPWDFNEAFGGHPMAGSREDQAELSVLQPAAPGNRLIDRVLANEQWAQAYRKLLQKLITTSCAPDRLNQQADQLAQLVQTAVFEESPAAKAAFQRIALGQQPARQLFPGRGPPGRPETTPLREWINRRMKNIRAELAGERVSRAPRMQGFPGRGGPPPPWRP